MLREVFGLRYDEIAEVVLLSDGGGVKQAVPRPVVGADKVARLPAGGMKKVTARVSAGDLGEPLSR